jgi:hypothetical protein
MKYLKTFESYSEQETCGSCGCDCENCDCENCDCGQESPVTEKKKSKPDFLDVDKDGDKKEPMKKASKEKGLSAKQKKLPEGLRKAIMARKKK